MNRLRKTVLGALLLSVVVTGCRTGPEYYKVELTPEGSAMLRSISRNFGPEHLEHTASVYGAELDAETLAKFEKKSTVGKSFTGKFTSSMPDDYHGGGTLLHCDSDFGSSSLYSERFGGNDNLAAMVADHEAAFHELWDLLLDALERLLGNERGFDELHQFLDTVARRDAWNIALTLSAVDTVGDTVKNFEDTDGDDEGTDIFYRLLHVLDNYGYIEIGSLWEYERQLDDIDSDDSHLLMEFVSQAIGRRMKTSSGDSPLPVLAKLATVTNKEFSDIFEALYEAHEQENGEANLEERAFRYDMNGFDWGGDALWVRLYLPEAPFETNGIWVEDTEGPAVQWIYPLASVSLIDSDLPHVVHASWSRPRDEFQAKHFGITVLEERPLHDYCLWYDRLSERRQSEWTGFVASLSPDDRLIQTMKSFQFSDEAPRDTGTDKAPILSAVAYQPISNIVRSIEGAREVSDP